MKRTTIGVITAAALGMSAIAVSAQTTVTIEPQVRTEVREYIVKQKRPSVKIKEEIRVGAQLPEAVTFYEIQGVPAATRYRYAIVNDRPVLVDPAQRTIVYVYE
jgi:hypothetical protein